MDRLLVDELLRLGDGDQVRTFLQGRHEVVTPELIDNLRDKVNQLIRVDIAEAVRVADLTWSIANLVQDPLAAALAMRARSQAFWANGQYEEALEWFNRAEASYREMGMELEAARVVRSKVTVLMYLGRYDEALALAEEARAAFERHGQLQLLAQLDTNVGNIYHRLDEYEKALEYYNRARAVFAECNDQAAMGVIETNRANALSMLNQVSTSAALYETARDLLIASGMPIEAAKAEYNLAYLLYIQRRYNESIRLFGKVKEFHLQNGSVVTAALCDMDLLEIYLELNLYDDVLSSCDTAEAVFTQLRRQYELAKVKTFRGLAKFHVGNLPAAAIDLTGARELFAKEGNRVYGALLDLYISALKLKEGKNDEAELLCRSAHEIFSSAGLHLRAAYAQLLRAQVARQRGEPDRARALAEEVLSCLQEHEAPWLAFQCYHLLGNLTAADDKAKAYLLYQSAIQYIEEMCAHIRPDVYKSSFLKDKLKVYEEIIELCLERNTPRDRAAAFAWVERAKSRSLVDLLSCTTADPATPSDQDVPLLRRWTTFREELNWLYDRLNNQEPPSDQRTTLRQAHLQGEIRAREQALADLHRQFQLNSLGSSPSQPSVTVSPEEARQCLLEDEVLLEFYLTDDSLKTFVLSKQGLEVLSRRVSRDEVGRTVAALQFQLEKFLYGPAYISRHMASLQRSANHYLQELYQLLLEPVQPMLAGKHLVIIPHDLLHYVPFHALWTGQEYVIDRHEVSYSPSASVFRLCQQKESPSSDQVLVLGVPGHNLPYSEMEALRVKELFPEGRLLLREAATREALYRCAANNRIIHIAAHGLFRYDNPLFSALRLYDSWLSFYDVYNMRLDADLVTLSGCHSGLSQVAQGDELMGLMRGFLYAGAASLVASLWAAHDRSTAAFMEVFYQALKEGTPKRTALRRAALAIKKEYDHPYHWAPFVLVGKR
ncbi:MAG: CHAT domain-containing protein [Acidobacteria bacterium]|nr:CHAT domain-containing protein [Acidobacteriota bacterium]MBI3658683.1 CHAT domain-containing protein [Acidobacteriota bacterium]